MKQEPAITIASKHVNVPTFQPMAPEPEHESDPEIKEIPLIDLEAELGEEDMDLSSTRPSMSSSLVFFASLRFGILFLTRCDVMEY